MEKTTQRKGRVLARGLFSYQERKKPAVRLLLFGGFLVLCGGALLTLAPIVWMALGAFKTPAEIYSVPQTYLPSGFGMDNFREALRLVPFGLYFLNSMFIAWRPSWGSSW
jgi:ABC-type glycerol-3-phosphate transport system permease component